MKDWILVSERLPEPPQIGEDGAAQYVEVLTFCDDGIDVEICVKKFYRWYKGFFWAGKNPTHWMSLPPNPIDPGRRWISR